MLEAVWSVDFISNERRAESGIAGGVILLEKGRMFGADSNYFYLGTYETREGKISAQVNIKNFTGITSLIFGEGLPEFSVQAEGTISDDSFVIQGHLIENADYEFGIVFKRLAELP
jgi:hypothetical protein